MSATSTTAAVTISTQRSFGIEAPKTSWSPRPSPARDAARVVAPDRDDERGDGEREPDRHEHLLDVAPVERPDQHELDEGGEDGAGDEADERGQQEAGEHRDAAELRLRVPGGVGADGEEGAVREVEHAHQAVDERQARGDQEVHRAEAEPVTVRRTMVLNGSPGRVARSSQATPSSLWTRSASARSAAAGPAYATRPPVVSTTACSRDAPDDAEVLLDEEHRRVLADALERLRHVRYEHRREALRRLVDEEDAVLVQERAGDRDHLLLPPGERAGELPAALLQLREKRVDEVVARGAVRARRA